MDIIYYEKKYVIPTYELGADGMLNPHSLFNFLLDIASEHAVKLRFGKDDLMKDNRFWVLSRIIAQVEIWPVLGETVIIKTWPRGTDKIFAIRDFTVSYPDGRYIASASSSWLIVDRTTRKIRRPDSLLSMFNTGLPAESSLGRNAGKLDPIDNPELTGNPFRVKNSDLDINLHTNSVAYIKWIFDSYDFDFMAGHRPSVVEVNYITESRWNDEIVIKTCRDKELLSVFNHSVTRSEDNTELCRVRIGWKNCSQQKVY
jgi:medium-chain acyl-[acyl-carrier-protein] hydrolase